MTLISPLRPSHSLLRSPLPAIRTYAYSFAMSVVAAEPSVAGAASGSGSVKQQAGGGKRKRLGPAVSLPLLVRVRGGLFFLI